MKNRYSRTCFFPSSVFSLSDSWIYSEPNMNPRIHPNGLERLPTAVASVLSSSPNQVVANLLIALHRGGWNNAINPYDTNKAAKLSVSTIVKYLAHEPIIMQAELTLNYKISSK